MSKGGSPFIERPAVESRATFDCARGFVTGVHGIGPWAGWSGMREERTLWRNLPVKRQGSTWRLGSGLFVADIATSIGLKS
jgi:hypothetical protein